MEQPATVQWPLTPGMEKSLIGTGATLRQVHGKAGASVPRHSHPHEQFILVIAGTAQLECDLGTISLQPNTALHFPANAWHSITFITDLTLAEFNLAQSE